MRSVDWAKKYRRGMMDIKSYMSGTVEAVIRREDGTIIGERLITVIAPERLGSYAARAYFQLTRDGREDR